MTHNYNCYNCINYIKYNSYKINTVYDISDMCWCLCNKTGFAKHYIKQVGYALSIFGIVVMDEGKLSLYK